LVAVDKIKEKAEVSPVADEIDVQDIKIRVNDEEGSKKGLERAFGEDMSGGVDRVMAGVCFYSGW
jgi:hypothetical protein